MVLISFPKPRVFPGPAAGNIIQCLAPSRSASFGIVPEHNERHKTITGVDGISMVLIPGGTYTIGSEDFPDARPLHSVSVSAFWMDEHEVTNAQFKMFVDQTGYKTVAERPLHARDFPGVPAENLKPGSAVFTPPSYPVSLHDPLQWWQYVPYANWKHPEGPHSSIDDRLSDPVVHICYEDAAAYAKWAGKRLPTEAEWEIAARGHQEAGMYYWGDELKPSGQWQANIFQGEFPSGNSLEDGYERTAPVKSYPPNRYGLYDMEGNVWEWCADLYRPDYYESSPTKNPLGPPNSFDPVEPGTVKYVQRGGSFLCSDQYCARYKTGSRGKGERNSASNNLGFRCVKTF